MTAERLACERVYHLLDLIGNHIASDEIRIIENRVKDLFGQQVLDQHLLNSRFREVRINRLTTLLIKTPKSDSKRTVSPPFLFD